MTYNKSKFTQVMMENNVYDAYVELVEYYRYINRKGEKRGIIKHLLLETFESKLREIKTEFDMSVCGNSKSSSQLTQQQHNCIKTLNKKFNISNWNYKEKVFIKIKLEEFNTIISNSFKVQGRDAITNHKTKILNILNLKQIRKSNSWFIVHNDWSEYEQEQINMLPYLKNKIKENISIKLQKQDDIGKFAFNDNILKKQIKVLENQIKYDRDKLNKYKSLGVIET